jgi:hypothetical protein
VWSAADWHKVPADLPLEAAATLSIKYERPLGGMPGPLPAFLLPHQEAVRLPTYWLWVLIFMHSFCADKALALCGQGT